MKFYFIPILFVLNLLIQSNQASSSKEWLQFKLVHNKLYETKDEEDLRFSIWQSNMKLIEEHNQKFEQGLVSFSLNINKFGDMTAKQFSSLLNGVDIGLARNLQASSRRFMFNPTVQLPHKKNWVNFGSVTRVKEQGDCGSCFAFSAVGALECLNFIENKVLVELSEQELLDCTSDFTYGNMGCDGGLMNSSFLYVKKSGVHFGDSYPYTGKKGFCRAKRIKGHKLKISGYNDISEGDEEALTQAISLQCVSVGIDASLASFQFYSSGVYTDKDCSSINLNHGVLAVGYGVDHASGQDYYLIKNSWGEGWGEGGYVKMSRFNDNNCGIASMASFPFM